MINETALTVVRNSLQRLKGINEELANLSMDLGTAMADLEASPTAILPLENAIGSIQDVLESCKDEVLTALKNNVNESNEDEKDLYSTIEDELNV